MDDEGVDEEKLGPTRRTVLKRVGLGVLGAGAIAAVGVPVARNLTAKDPAISVVPRAAPLRIDQVTVIDPRDGSKSPGMSVIVRDGRITTVAATKDTPAGPDTWAIDGAGRFAVPGYNNMHTHVLQEERASLFMATMLAEGTTGMRQMAGTDDLLRFRAENRLPLGVHTPGLLAMPGELLMPWNAGSVQEVREEITRQKDLGADFIKLISVDREVFFEAVSWAHGQGMKIAGHLPPSVSPTEAVEAGYDSIEHFGAGSCIWIETSSDEKTLRGQQDLSGPVPGWFANLPFAGWLFSTDLVAGMAGKTLINPALSNSPQAVDLMRRALGSFDDTAAQEMLRRFAAGSTWQTPTLVRLRTQYVVDDPEYDNHPSLRMLSAKAVRDFQDARAEFMALPADTRAVYHQAYDMSLRMVKRIHDAGVPVMTGTDGPGKNPADLHTEFRELAAAGLRPLDVLRTVTTEPAAYLGRSDRMGAIAPGMDADFLLLDSDPLEDVRNLASVAAVVRAGHFLPRQEIDSLVEELLAAAR
ncbi:amidohydrolase family protein [Lentzea sp. NPDC059081]|uniref:amidohydrolase family protein n=1 Tax=Lentzea sp. NPDC059081 TaxID=3346719 RepID=UPI0036AB1AF2